jgi:hypothetical protein
MQFTKFRAVADKKSVINMGTKVYNYLPKFLKQIENYNAFKKELKLFFFFKLFTQWKNLYLLSDSPMICIGLVIVSFMWNYLFVYYLRCFIK